MSKSWWSLWFWVVGAMACQEIPWGTGGGGSPLLGHPLIQTWDEEALARAAGRLWDAEAGVRSLPLQEIPTSWGPLKASEGEALHLEGVRLLLPALERGATPVDTAGERVDLYLALVWGEQALAWSLDTDEGACEVPGGIAAGAVRVPVQFRVARDGQVVAGVAGAQALIHGEGGDVRFDLGACVEGAGDLALNVPPDDQAEMWLTLAKPILAKLPEGLGMDSAVYASTHLNRDHMGASRVAFSLRPHMEAPFRRHAGGLSLHHTVGLEVQSHPCMGPLKLAPIEPVPEISGDEGGISVAIKAVERLVRSAWAVGGLCGSRLGVVTEPAEALVGYWPALGELGGAGALSLELWPGSLPHLEADPEIADAVLLRTGRMRFDVMATHLGAKWRLASVMAELDLSLLLWISEEGGLFADPVDASWRVLGTDAGLVEAPEGEALTQLLRPLIEVLISDREILRLPRAWVGDGGAPRLQVERDRLHWGGF